MNTSISVGPDRMTSRAKADGVQADEGGSVRVAGWEGSLGEEHVMSRPGDTAGWKTSESVRRGRSAEWLEQGHTEDGHTGGPAGWTRSLHPHHLSPEPGFWCWSGESCWGLW